MIVNGYSIKAGANLRDADLQGADLRGADLQGADLEGAYLQGAYLEGANLFGANLYGANLYGADLRYANLRGAELRRAYLMHTKGVIAFTLGRHFGFTFKCDGTVYVKIGCECHTLEYWLRSVEEIGKKYSYTNFEIEYYKAQLNLIAMMEYRKERT